MKKCMTIFKKHRFGFMALLVLLCSFSVSAVSTSSSVSALNPTYWNSYTANKNGIVTELGGTSNLPIQITNPYPLSDALVGQNGIWFSLPNSVVGKVGASFDLKIKYWPNSPSIFWECGTNYNVSVVDTNNLSNVSTTYYACNKIIQNNTSILVFDVKVVMNSKSASYQSNPNLVVYVGNVSSSIGSSNYSMAKRNDAGNSYLLLGVFDVINQQNYSDPNTAILNQITNQNQTMINQNSTIINNQQAHTEAINNQTAQDKDQYEQEKAEESEREDSQNDQAGQLAGIFNFTALNPFSGIFALFTAPTGCVSIPIIAGMLNTDQTTYCPWFPASVRNILTPVIGLAAMILLFGFFIRWLNGSGGDGTINTKGGYYDSFGNYYGR